MSSRVISSFGRDEVGFTLIETLVAMVSGLVVVAALFSILEISLLQTFRINDRVQADQIGRTALTKVVDQLQSACLAREFTPVQLGSSESKITFITAYSKESMITNSEAYKQTIEWTGAAGGYGSLVEYSAKSNGGTWPSFTFEETPKKTVIAENVYRTKVEVGKATEELPIFKYYKYNSTTSEGSETPLGALTPLTLAKGESLSTETAKTAAAVLVSFTTAPGKENIKRNRSIALSNQVTLAFSAPSAETTIKDAPCQ